MKPTVLFLAYSLVGISDASGLELSDQASRCWAVPAVDEALTFTAEFAVDLDGNGAVTDITVTSYLPATATGKKIVLTASQAIELCSPYDIAAAGTYQFKFVGAEMFGTGKPPIDPFK